MSKKSTTSNKPPKEFMPYIERGVGALDATYSQNRGQIQDATDSVVGLLPSMIDKYEQGNAATNAATDYNVGVLSGQYLDGNPYLDDIISASNDDLRNQMQAAMGTRGQTGGSSYADLISKNVLRNSTNLRYSDYNAERGRMGQAAAQSPALAASDYLSVTPMLQTLQSSTLPMQAASGYAGGIGGLLGGYGQQTSRPSDFNSAMQGIGTALSAAAMFSDERLKTDIKPVGATDGGLTIYSYRYGGEGPFHMGVMAQDVREAQPEALGPEVSGYLTVDYGKVR